MSASRSCSVCPATTESGGASYVLAFFCKIVPQHEVEETCMRGDAVPDTAVYYVVHYCVGDPFRQGSSCGDTGGKGLGKWCLLI